MTRILTSALDDYLRDESNLGDGWADRVVLPECEADVIDFLRSCQSAGEPVTISGARTGIVGGAVPRGGAVLSTERLAAVEEIRYDRAAGEWRVRLEPGVRLEILQALAARKEMPDGYEPAGLAAFRADPGRYFFPIDATETTASLGGMAATNASGARTYSYGAMRVHVRALRLALADGEILRLCRGETSAPPRGTILLRSESGRVVAIPVPGYHAPAVKHTAGLYAASPLDPLDLFLGSEGTLGVITELELALAPAPEAWFGGLAFFPDEEAAVRLVRIVRDERPPAAAACRPAALEYFDDAALALADREDNRRRIGLPALPSGAGAAVFFEQGCAETGVEEVYEAWGRTLALCSSSIEDVWSALEERDQIKLKSLRHSVPEEINRRVAANRRRCPAIHKVGTDLAVPDRHLGEMVRNYRQGLAREGIPAVVFGHIGENNLHVNMLPADEDMFARAKRLHRTWAILAVDLGGTVAAEHGIGKLKGGLLPVLYCATELDEMAAVKRALDPHGLLSPGNGAAPEATPS